MRSIINLTIKIPIAIYTTNKLKKYSEPLDRVGHTSELVTGLEGVV